MCAVLSKCYVQSVQQFKIVANQHCSISSSVINKLCSSHTHVFCAFCACAITTAATTTEQMLACEHVIGKCAESDAVVALFLQRRRASDYLVVSYSNRAALTADRMQRYQVRVYTTLHKKLYILWYAVGLDQRS
jgi:hypothetical protein